jgi:hypothetical protein
MPIKQISKTFTDIFGNITSTYKANAGDKITLKSTFESSIQMTSLTDNPLILNSIDNEIYCYGKIGWLKEGFRLSDTIDVLQYTTATGVLLTTESGRTITYISDTTIRVSGGTLASFDSTINTMRVKNSRNHAELELNVNHVINSYPSSSNSLIDGEETKIVFKDLSTIIVTGTSTGVIVGNKSGQFIVSAVITRLADVTYSKQFKLTLVYIQSGIYDKSWFGLGECLKLNLDYKFRSVANDTTNLIEFSDSDTANTGWFNEAYNVDVIDATLTTGINQLDYNASSTHTIVVNSASSSLYLGACFISSNEDYYKNKYNSQIDLTLLLNAYVPLAVGVYTSNGGLYSIEVTSIVTVGSVRTIELVFMPLTGFSTFVESFDIDDRLFYIWVKAGNVNLLASSGQLYKNIANVQNLFVDSDGETFIRHDENVETATEIVLTKSNIEDDLAYTVLIPTDPFDTFNTLKCSIVSYNSVTFEEIELESVLFDISNAPINSSGQYILNEYQSVGNDLPTTSLKKKAHLTNNLTTDVWKIYYPFINNWKYWEKQTNAPNDFYPNQNKNWLNYITGNWSLKVKTSRTTDDVEFIRRKSLPFSYYNTEPLIDTTIELYRSDNTLVTAIFDNEIMTIKAVHEHLTVVGSDYWGQITIEETETSPRYLLSTEIDYDYNTNSPITPITGLRLTSTNIANITTFSCLLDASKCPDNVKITSKIFLKGAFEGVQFENGDLIQFEDNTYLEWD